jgi:hypothetical protein
MANSNSFNYNNTYSLYIIQNEIQEISVKKGSVIEVITNLELSNILTYFNGKQISLSVLRKTGLFPPSLNNYYYYIAEEDGIFTIAYKKKPITFNIAISNLKDFEKKKKGFLAPFTSTLKSVSIVLGAIITILLIILVLVIVKSTKEVLR